MLFGARQAYAQEPVVPTGPDIFSQPGSSNWGLPCFPPNNSSGSGRHVSIVPSATNRSYYGHAFTPSDSLRVLVVYAGLSEDNQQGNTQIQGNNSDATNAWPQTDLVNTVYGEALPRDAYGNQKYYTDYNSFSASATDQSISNYYYQMSRTHPGGKPLKMVVSHLPRRINVPINPDSGVNWTTSYSPTTTLDTLVRGTVNWDFANFQVMRQLARDYDGSPYSFDWATVDRRHNNPNYANDYSGRDPDQKIDFIIVIWRLTGSVHNLLVPQFMDQQTGQLVGPLVRKPVQQDGAGGWAVEQFDGPNLTKTGAGGQQTSYGLGPGFIQIFGLQGLEQRLFTHEVAHVLYDSPHYFGANGIHGQHFHLSNGWGMMGSEVAHTANAWERWYLGWINLTASSVPSDIADASSLQNGGVYTLRDFSTTGDVLRIRLPYADSVKHPLQGGNMTPQYLWLENHQGGSVFDEPRMLTDGNGQAFPPAARGLFAFIDDMDATPTEPFTSFWASPQRANAFKVLANQVAMRDSANRVIGWYGGHNDYTPQRPPSRFRTSNNPSPDSTYGYLWRNHVYDLRNPVTNPLSGQSEVNWFRMDKYDWLNNDGQSSPISSNSINYSDCINGGCGDETALFGVLNETRMGGLQGPDIGFNTVGDKLGMMTNPAITPHQKYSASTQRLSDIWFHGLSVELIGKNPTTGAITVRVRFDDTDVQPTQNDLTRWCGQLVLPDLPGVVNDIHIPKKLIVRIDQSGTPARQQQHFITGTFAPPTTMRCLAGAHIQVDSSSTLIVRNHSTLTLDRTAGITIEGESYLRIESGSTLIIEDEAYVVAKAGARVEVADDARIIIRNTMSGKGLQVLNGAQLIVSGNGRVIVEDGARLELLSAPATGQRSRLALLDDASEILNHGRLITAPNVPFTFAGRGLITFSGSGAVLSLGVGSEWVQTGPGRPNPMYQFLEGAQISTKTPHLALTGGKLFYDQESRLTVELTNGGSATFERIEFASNPVAPGAEALICQNAAQLTVNACLVHDFYYNGLVAVKTDQVFLTASYVSQITKGAGLTLDGCTVAVLDRGEVRDCETGVSLSGGKLWLRNGHHIHGSQQAGIFAKGLDGVPARIVAGDVGCAWITDNEGGAIVGEDTWLDLDAVIHQTNTGSTLPQMNRFDGNNATQSNIFDICYSDASLVPPTGLYQSAEGNYWGSCTGGLQPIDGQDYRMVYCGTRASAYGLTTNSFVSCLPTGCASCDKPGDGEEPGGNGSGRPATLAADLAPNPAADQTVLLLNQAGAYCYRVVDARGGTQATGTFTGAQATIRTSGWPAGAYRVVVWSAESKGKGGTTSRTLAVGL